MIDRISPLLRANASRILLLLVVSGAVIAIWPTWPPLVRVWHETADYEHGYVVLLVCLIWLYMRSADLPVMSARPSATAGVLLVGALCGWLVAHRAGSAIGEQMLSPAIIVLATWMACGLAVARHVGPAILYLYFAIPVWDLLLPVLQAGTIRASGIGLGWLDISATIRGDIVTIPEGSFQVVEGCAGKRFLLVSLAMATLFAALLHLNRNRALLLFAITTLLAIVANWLRVITIIYAGHVSNMQHYLVAREHHTFGWFVYAVLFAAVYYIGTRLAGPPKRHEQDPQRTLHRLLPGAAALGMTLLVVCIAPAAMAYSTYFLPPASAGEVRAPQSPSEAWLGPQPPDLRWLPSFHDADSTMRASYVSASEVRVEVFAARYLSQRQDVELIHEANTVLGKKWRSQSSGRLETSVPHVQVVRAVSPANEEWLISYVYEVGDVVTGSGVSAQLAYGLGSWVSNPAATVFAAATRCTSSCDTASAQLTGFWNSIGALLLD